MADCLSAVGWSASQFALGDTSDIFDLVDSATNFTGESVDVGQILPPEIPALVLGTELADPTFAGLIDPSQPPRTPPGAAFTSPNFEQAAYQAVVSLIDFAHNSDLISDISYVDGLDFVEPPDTDMPAPPLDYPTSGTLPVPEAPPRADLDAPDFSELGTKPTLRPIEFTPFTLSGLEPLDLCADIPEYEPPDAALMPWRDEVFYEDDEGFRATLKQLMAGDGELARWVEGLTQQKLYEQLTRTHDLEAKRQIDRVMADAAARNFSLPNGPTEERVMAVAGEELEKGFQASVQVRDEVYQASMNALTTAIQQAIRVERYHFGLHVRYLRQNLRVYQLNLALAADAYNTLVQVTNTLVGFIRAKVDAYNQYVSALTDENRAVLAQTAFSDAEVDTFLARLGMYDADVSLLRKAVQTRSADIRDQAAALTEYELALRGELANADVLQQNVSAFQRAIQAHNTSLQWQDDVLAAYEAAVNASGSKAQVEESKFGSYRRLLAAEGARADSYRNYVNSSLSVLDAEIRRFRQAADSQQNYLASIRDALGSSFSAVSTIAGIAEDSARHAGSYNAARISYTAATNDTEVAKSVLDMTREALAAEVAVQRNRLDAARESARVTAAGALSQASSTIFGIRVSADGRASERVSGRDSGRLSFSGQNRRTYAKQCVQDIQPLG